ncbi:hypothetical protein BJ944DRAFT_261953 [Cunninghamella echinulata]|nr:hypothetical protein BJ944DRAFT_261953 [Cunninghamella echinulata]
MLEYEYEDLPNSIDGLLQRMNQELTCPICLSLFNQSTSTPCGHIFCKQCILHSLINMPKCPICKATITKRALSFSESTEAIVQEFFILRQHYEKKTGIVLSQLPNKEYEAEPQNSDLSLLFPYPTKEDNSATNGQTIMKKEQNKIEPTENTMEQEENDDDDNDRQTLSTPAINKFQSHVEAPHFESTTLNEVKQGTFCTTQDTTDSWTEDHNEQQQQPLKFKVQPTISSSTATTTASSSLLSSSNTMNMSQLDPPPKNYFIYLDEPVNDLVKTYLKKLENLQILKISTTINSKITHFIVAADDQNNVLKIDKIYLGAILLRKHIVHENWIKHCFEEKTMVNISPYLVHSKLDKYKDGPQRARLSYLNGEPKLFYNKRFYFYPNNNVKSQTGIQYLINLGDGQIVTTENDIKKDTIILCTTTTTNNNDHGKGKMNTIFLGKPLVKATWVTESVLRYKLLNIHDFYY